MRIGINAKLLFYILLVIVLIFTVTIAIVSFNNHKKSLRNAMEMSHSMAQEYSNQAEINLNEYMDASRLLAQQFEDYKKIPEQYRRALYANMMQQVLRKNENFIGVWSIWLPATIDNLDEKYINTPGSTRLGNFSHTYFREGDQIKLELNDPNTILFKSDYFTIPQNSLKETLLDPYYYSYSEKTDQVLQTNLITPIIVDGEFQGIVGVDAPLTNFQEWAEKIKPFGTGYTVMLSADGQVVAGPDASLLGKKVEELYPDFSSDNNLLNNIKKGKDFSFKSVDPFLGSESYFFFAPLNSGNAPQTWTIGVVVPMKTIRAQANEGLWLTIIIGLVGLILLTLVIIWVSSRITRPLITTTRVLKQMARGEVDSVSELRILSQDEIGDMTRALNSLAQSIKNSARFAVAIGQGKLEEKYRPVSRNDLLGNSLVKMQQNLLKLNTEINKNAWLQESLVELADIMRGQKEIRQLANDLIRIIAEKAKAQAGAIYLMDPENNTLKLTGSYAFTTRKSNASTFKVGEGLVGQAALENKSIEFENVPGDFIYIQSGLSEGEAPSVFIQPCSFDGKVAAVIELASVRPFEPHIKQMLDRTEESVAIAVNSLIVHIEMEKLLNKTQEQAEELRVQQEELKESNEELEQQTRTLRESEEKLQIQQEELRVANEELQEKTDHLQAQRKETELKNEMLEKAGKELEIKAAELEQASKYKSEFLANMSHELRTPLNSLLILSKNLADNKKGNLNADQVESAEIIYNSGNELLTLINDILDLSKIEAGKMDITIEDIDPHEIADYTRMHFRHMIENKKLEFVIDVHPQTGDSLHTDRQRLEQVIKNLMSNAIKFTHQGSITFKIEPMAASGNFQNPNLRQNGGICFSIIDTGIGIKEEKRKAIFEAFQQADGSTSRKYGGTGLGLSISREIARLLNGEIRVESEYGKGSRFSIILPMGEKEAITSPVEASNEIKNNVTSSAPPAQGNPAEGQNNTKVEFSEPVVIVEDDRDKIQQGDTVILLVEDDPNFAKILYQQAKNRNFKGIVCGSGEDAITMAERIKPDAVVLDIHLPGMSGWQVLDHFKNSAELRHIPVHMMSGYERNIDALKKGAIGYLTKPIKNEELESAFDKLEDFIQKKMSSLLLVEDDANLRRSIKKIIGETDISITDAGSGKEAMEALKTKNFDCMILDLGLPDMTGFELLKKLNKEIKPPLPPIIVYTGRELSKDENFELQKYTDSIIIKGVKSEDRLVDETALFLHRMVNKLPAHQQEMISMLHDEDQIFANKKVMIVDDDMRNVIALTKVLEDKQIEITAAENGEKALQLLDDEKGIDLVLMDIMMPVMDGYETISRIRKNLKHKNLPIIALTAKAMKEDRSKCINAGANDYITKPVNIEKLLTLMRVWLYS